MNVIGSRVFVRLENQGPIPAKIDTGADSSSVWASGIRVKNGTLTFVLFDEGSEFYTGDKIHCKNFSTIRVKNSTGHSETRYVVKLRLELADRKIRARFTLSNRSRNRYPILIGRRTLKGKFIVDVSQGDIEPEAPTSEVVYNEKSTN